MNICPFIYTILQASLDDLFIYLHIPVIVDSMLSHYIIHSSSTVVEDNLFVLGM